MENMFEYVKVLFHYLPLNIMMSISTFSNVSLDYWENFPNGLICNGSKMDFLGKVQYLGKVSW